MRFLKRKEYRLTGEEYCLYIDGELWAVTKEVEIIYEYEDEEE